MNVMVDVHAQAREQLDRYLRRFPQESERLKRVRHQVRSGENCLARNNMAGHITTSALVLNHSGSMVLLVHHVALGKWVSPGGHYEAPGGLLDSALRELAEETGIADGRPHAWTVESGIPFDIDTCDIRENFAKGEGAHVHHDFLFLVTASDGSPLRAQLDEVHAAVWLPLPEFGAADDECNRRVFAKLRAAGLLDRACPLVKSPEPQPALAFRRRPPAQRR